MAILIDSAEALAQVASDLSGVSEIAVDTESNSFHRYHERLCLLQLSVESGDEVRDYLIDPLANLDPAPLVAVFADPKISKVFHDVGYDLILIRRDWKVTPAPIFDTMLALRMLGHKQFGLATVLEQRFAFRANKALQRADWSQRPLTPAQLTYAAADTHYLLPLAHQLEEELKKSGRWQWFEEECQRSLRRPEARGKSEDERFWGLKGVKKLDPEALAVAHALFVLREERAKALDRAVFRVMHNETLIALAEKRPTTRQELAKIPGVGGSIVHSMGDRILAACTAPPPFALERSKPEHKRRSSAEERERDKRYEHLREKRKVAAERLGLEPEVVLSNATLWELAEHEQRDVANHPDFAGWRRDIVTDFA